MKTQMIFIIPMLIAISSQVYAQTELQASSKVIVDDGYDHAELSVNGWGGSHGLFFGSKINYKGADNLWGNGNAEYAQMNTQYSYGAFSLGYIANGGIFGFYDGGASTGANNPITWNPVMTMFRGGNIGVGMSISTTPEEKMDINGNVMLRNNGNLILRSANNDPGDLIFRGFDNTEFARVYSGNDKLFFSAGTSAFPRMTIIGSSGNVGIGTDNPGTYRLAVEGTVGARKVKVTQSAWADYVFYPTYRLRPLSEVEKYIQQHHQLPEVPSAAEVEKNGLDLGDNQAILLKKIEELTLYLIQQDKRIQELEKQLKGK